MSEDSQGRELVSRLALDVKALTLLYESDDRLRGLLKKELLDSKDESMRRFMGLLNVGQRSGQTGALLVALGQMVLAALLALLGIVAFVPSLAGLNTPKEFGDYLSGFVPSSFGSGPLFSAAIAVVFVLAALLMLGSFYALRQASVNLKQAGFVVDQSER